MLVFLLGAASGPVSCKASRQFLLESEERLACTPEAVCCRLRGFRYCEVQIGLEVEHLHLFDPQVSLL